MYASAFRTRSDERLQGERFAAALADRCQPAAADGHIPQRAVMGVGYEINEFHSFGKRTRTAFATATATAAISHYPASPGEYTHPENVFRGPLHFSVPTGVSDMIQIISMLSKPPSAIFRV